jgi:hypothetical protein
MILRTLPVSICLTSGNNTDDFFKNKKENQSILIPIYIMLKILINQSISKCFRFIFMCFFFQFFDLHQKTFFLHLNESNRNNIFNLLTDFELKIKHLTI